MKNMGLTDTKTYKSWQGIIQRCTNSNNPSWKNYGGRGISVCERWKIFNNFLMDMGEKPSEKYSIDRVDNNLGYFKENCRWTLQLVQVRNTRWNRVLTFYGKTKCLSEWAESLGIQRKTLAMRLDKLGWSLEKALTTPARKLVRKDH